MRRFPAEAVSIRVPPSTHFGYSIEWALLGMLTLVIGTLVQINPWKRRPEDVNPKPAEMVPDMVIDTERPH